MDNYDGLAEELVLLQEHIKNVGKEYYAMRAHSPTNPDWDIVAFELDNQSPFYKRTTYQVKEINWQTSNKTIAANFQKLNADFVFIVIFNSNKGIDKEQPVIFKVPKSAFEQKTKDYSSSILTDKFRYSISKEGKQYISLDTIFNNDVLEDIRKYAYYNLK